MLFQLESIFSIWGNCKDYATLDNTPITRKAGPKPVLNCQFIFQTKVINKIGYE